MNHSVAEISELYLSCDREKYKKSLWKLPKLKTNTWIAFRQWNFGNRKNLKFWPTNKAAANGTGTGIWHVIDLVFQTCISRTNMGCSAPMMFRISKNTNGTSLWSHLSKNVVLIHLLWPWCGPWDLWRNLSLRPLN